MNGPGAFSRATRFLLLLCLVPRVGAGQIQPTPPPPDSLPASAYLGLLPDGPDKRKFILDCTGCHQLHKGIAFPEGEPRTRASWREAVTRMLAYAGPETDFPVIGPERDPRATAAWLSTHLRELPPGAGRDTDLPPGARIDEYAFPVPQDLPHDLMVDPRGRVVVTGMFTHRMVVLDPATGEWTPVPIPVEQANPRALEIDDQGGWWVVLGAPNALAYRDPESGEWSRHDVGMYAHSIVEDPEGRIWFNGHFTVDPPRLGYVDPATGRVRVVDAPANRSHMEGGGPIPYGLRAAPDGEIWMTELHGNRIVGFDPERESFRTFSMPTPESGPRRPDLDAEGVLWIPEYAANKLARFDPASETFREFDLPLPDALPYVVRVDRDRDRVWIGTGAADAVLHFDPYSEEFTVYPVASRGALIRHIDVDRRTGDLWVAYGQSPGTPTGVARIRVGGDRAPSGG